MKEVRRYLEKDLFNSIANESKVKKIPFRLGGGQAG